MVLERGRANGVHKLLRFLCMLGCFAPFAPVWSEAQSGRHKPSPAGSPSTQRPKPAETTEPASPTGVVQPPTASTTISPIITEPKTQQRPTAGVTSGAPENDSEEVVRITSNLVPITASVTDTLGRAVADLQLQDFELLIDGQPKAISDISRSDTPVRMVLLFDNSSSLSAAREFEKKAAMRFFRRVLRPVDQAAIYSISTVPLLEQSFTSDIPTLVRTIEDFGKPVGATALFDTVAQAAKYQYPQQGRKVIVIVSDGTDTLSTLDFNKSLQLVQATNCQVYVVQTGHSTNANLRDLTGERRLEEYALQTGGARYTPQSTAELDAAFTQIAADLAQQYILSYYPMDEPADNRFRKITLHIQNRPGVRVRARKGYYSPKG